VQQADSPDWNFDGISNLIVGWIYQQGMVKIFIKKSIYFTYEIPHCGFFEFNLHINLQFGAEMPTVDDGDMEEGEGG
jgi:hypothetical protein